MIDQMKLREYAASMGLALTDAQLLQFDLYARLLVEWNQKMNLTAITDPEGILVKHFVDSLTLLSAAGLEEGASLVDVGTGAGFPSVPVKIARPDLRITLMDSLNKRLVFLEALSQALGQQNACVHARAEEAGRLPAHRERYRYATARAVAHLRELCEYCLPLVEPGGCFIALKGGALEQELEESRKAVQALGGKVEALRTLNLPDGSKRTLVSIRKISHTSTKYPRPHAKIAKNPLV